VTGEQVIRWLPIAMPLLFVGLWLVISALLGAMSGWFGLQQWYPDDGSEEPLLTLRGQSGSVSFVAFNNALTLKAYRSGFGLSISRFFAPFLKPLMIPWGEVKVEETTTFFVPMVRLQFGEPSNGSLKISARTWSKLAGVVAQAGGDAAPKLPAILATSGDVARGMFVQWAVISAFFATFFFIGPRFWGANAFPLFLFAVIPVILGVAMLIQYARQA
jgi:hypothetical protein